MKHLYFLFVLGLLCISKVDLYGQQKNIFRKVNAEIGVGVVFGSKKIGFDQIGAGASIYAEGRYNFTNSHIDAGLHLSGSIFHRKSKNAGSLYFKSYNVMAISDYNLFIAKGVSLFAGAGVGLCICNVSSPIGFDNSKRNWGGFTTGDKTHSFSFMPRAGVELFNHWRLTFNYKLQEKANINYGITLGYAFGAGAKKSIR